jgi:hypothetical protein
MGIEPHLAIRRIIALLEAIRGRSRTLATICGRS